MARARRRTSPHEKAHRTRDAFRDQFARAALRLSRVVATACPPFVPEAVRA